MVKIGNKLINSKNNCRKYTLLYVPIHFCFETPMPKVLHVLHLYITQSLMQTPLKERITIRTPILRYNTNQYILSGTGFV